MELERTKSCPHFTRRLLWFCLACGRKDYGCGCEAYLKAACLTWREGLCSDCRAGRKS